MTNKNNGLVVEMKANEGFGINSGFITESTFDAVCEDTDFNEAIADEYDGCEVSELSATPDNLYLKIGDSLEELALDDEEIKAMFTVTINGQRVQISKEQVVVIPVLTENCDVDDEEIADAGMVRIENAVTRFPSRAAYEYVRNAYNANLEAYEEILDKVAEGTHMFFSYIKYGSVTGVSEIMEKQAKIIGDKPIDASKIRIVLFASTHAVPWADRFTDIDGDLESLPFAPCGLYFLDVMYDDMDMFTSVDADNTQEPELNVVVEYSVDDEPVAVCC